jgi:uncharacterized protein YbaA (DUF1428 family)
LRIADWAAVQSSIFNLQSENDLEVQMPYVDGFVVPLPRKKLGVYRRIARQAGKIWKQHGALEYRECAGEDLKQNMGLPFPRLARLKPGEMVMFSWIVYKNRRDRDRVNAKVMKDPRMERMMKIPMPFNMKRMAYGGFKVIVDM